MTDKPTSSHVQEPNPLDMPPKKSNSKKILLILLVVFLFIASVGGTYYYMNKQCNDQKKQQQDEIDALNKKLNELQNSTTSQTNSKPVQTKQYTTKYEKLKFSYPNTFTLTDNSTTQELVQPGTDKIILNNGNYNIDLQTGLYGIGGECSECKVLLSEPIEIMGKKYFVNYVSNDGGPKVDMVIIGSNAQDTFGVALTSKNITPVNAPSGDTSTGISIHSGYKTGNTTIPKSVTELQNDPNTTAFKNFVKSFSY